MTSPRSYVGRACDPVYRHDLECYKSVRSDNNKFTQVVFLKEGLTIVDLEEVCDWSGLCFALTSLRPLIKHTAVASSCAVLYVQYLEKLVNASYIFEAACTACDSDDMVLELHYNHNWSDTQKDARSEIFVMAYTCEGQPVVMWRSLTYVYMCL